MHDVISFFPFVHMIMYSIHFFIHTTYSTNLLEDLGLERQKKMVEKGRKHYVYWYLGPLRLWFPSKNATFAF